MDGWIDRSMDRSINRLINQLINQFLSGLSTYVTARRTKALTTEKNVQTRTGSNFDRSIES